jgi:multicomponent Na+:H+ antiporter subunit G
MKDLIVAICIIIGTFFIFVAALGVIRMPDVFLRMHATTKASTLGIMFLVAAVGIHFQQAGVIGRGILVIAFFLLTAPIAAQVIGRAAYLSGVTLWNKTVIDEYRATLLDPHEDTASEMVGEQPSGPLSGEQAEMTESQPENK